MKKRLLVLGSLICVLALLCACGGDGGSVIVLPAISTPSASASAQSAKPTAKPLAPPSPSPAQSPAWAAAYAETINALAREDPELTYDLIYVDADDVPELVADKTGYYVYLFTYTGGQVQTLMDGWGYGAMGNPGYEYAPRANAIYNANADFAGALYHETCMKIGAGGQLEDYYDYPLTTWYFEDLNGNNIPDDGEFRDTPIYRYGDQVITEAEANTYKIPGTYQMIQGTMTQDQILAVLENM